MGEMERRGRGDEVEKRRRIGSTGGPGRGSQRQPGCGGEKGKKSRSRGVTRFTVYSMNSKVAWGLNWEWKRERGRERTRTLAVRVRLLARLGPKDLA